MTEPPQGSAGGTGTRWGGRRGLLKLLFGLLILSVLLIRVDLGEVARVFRQIEPVYLGLAVLAFLALLAVQAWRLHLLIGDVTEGFGATLRLVMVGFFFNNLLPTNVGGDAYKVLYVQRRGRSWEESVGLVVLDRAAGVLGIAVAGVVAALFALPALSRVLDRLGSAGAASVGGPGAVGGWALGVGALVLGACLLLWRSRRVRDLARRSLFRIRHFLSEVRTALGRVPARVYGAVLALSVLTFLVRLLRFVLYLYVFRVTFPLAEVALVLVVMNLVGFFPAGMGGLGVQEGVIAVGFGLLGAPLAVGTAVAFLNRGLTWALALAGGLLFTFGRRFGGR